MLRADHRAGATLALFALASLAGITPVHARGENPRASHESRAPERERQGARRQPEARQTHRSSPAHAPVAHAAARRQPSYPRERSVANYQREAPAGGVQQHRPANDGATRETPPTGGSRTRAVYRAPAGDHIRVVRYGNGGTVERTIRPGFVSRTFVGGGHVMYTHVYQAHVWHQYGREFAYETFVPGVRFPAVYYGWALAAWPRPVAYYWGWRAQPWYPAYGVLFTPYPVYTSPDLWMTDYIIAQSMQAAYQAQYSQPPPPTPGAYAAPPAPDSTPAPPAPQSGDPAAAPQPVEPAPTPQPSEAPPAPTAMPPAMTPQVKAELNTQIKVQLREQQDAETTPATLTTQSTPPALRPNHVFFEVVQPLDVPSDAANGFCALTANDYIKRTGGVSQDDWKIPVVVELSGPSDCPQGLHTRIGLNDLNAMENEQEARVMEAMQAASKRLGPNGPPSGPGVHPTLIADGNAAPDPMALEAVRQAQ